MAYIIDNNSYDCGIGCGTTTFSACCNEPIVVDSRYQSRYFQEVYYAPEPAPQVQVVRQRLPDPPPDVIEKVVIVPQPKKYIYQVVEVPTKPPPVIKQRVVQQPPNPTLCGGTYRVQVPHGPNAHASQVIQSPSYVQASPSIIQGTHSFIQGGHNIIQGTPTLIQQSPIAYSSSNVLTI